MLPQVANLSRAFDSIEVLTIAAGVILVIAVALLL